MIFSPGLGPNVMLLPTSADKILPTIVHLASHEQGTDRTAVSLRISEWQAYYLRQRTAPMHRQVRKHRRWTLHRT
jgi:hypothetical protein